MVIKVQGRSYIDMYIKGQGYNNNIDTIST